MVPLTSWLKKKHLVVCDWESTIWTSQTREWQHCCLINYSLPQSDGYNKWQVSQTIWLKKVPTNNLTKQEGLLTDTTGTIKVVFWEHFVDMGEEGKTYKFENFVYKDDRFGRYIGTAREGSSLVEIDDMKDAPDPKLMSQILQRKMLLWVSLESAVCTSITVVLAVRRKLKTLMRANQLSHAPHVIWCRHRDMMAAMQQQQQ